MKRKQREDILQCWQCKGYFPRSAMDSVVEIENGLHVSRIKCSSCRNPGHPCPSGEYQESNGEPLCVDCGANIAEFLE